MVSPNKTGSIVATRRLALLVWLLALGSSIEAQELLEPPKPAGVDFAPFSQNHNFNYRAMLSVDNSTAVVRDGSDGFRLCSTKTGKTFGARMAHPSKFRVFVRFCGPYLFTYDNDRNNKIPFRVWNAKTGEPVAVKSAEVVGQGRNYTVSHTGKLLAWVSAGKVRVLEVLSGKQVGLTLDLGDRFDRAQTEFSPDGMTLAVHSKTAFILWDVREGKEIARYRLTGELAAGYSWDSKVLLARSSKAIRRNDRIERFETELRVHSFPGEQKRAKQEPIELTDSVSTLSPDGGSILVSPIPRGKNRSGVGSAAFLVDWRTRKRTHTLWAKGIDSCPLAKFDPSGNVVATVFAHPATASKKKRWSVWLWDSQTGEPLSGPLWFDHVVTDINFSEDGTTFATFEQTYVTRFGSGFDPPSVRRGERGQLRVWQTPKPRRR